MNALDLCFIILTILLFALGLARGFWRSLWALLAFFLAFFLANYLYQPIANKLSRIFETTGFNLYFFGFTTIFALTLMVARMADFFLKIFLPAPTIGNRLLGGFIELLRSIAILSLISIFLGKTNLQNQVWWQKSLAHQLEGLAKEITPKENNAKKMELKNQNSSTNPIKKKPKRDLFTRLRRKELPNKNLL